MGNHSPDPIDRARNDLFSQVIRCDVLEAPMSEREDWLEDTVSDYISLQYPHLTELQLAQIRIIGRRFIQPPIPHGAHANATNRPEWNSA